MPKETIDTPGLLSDFISRPSLARELNKTQRSLQLWERRHFGPPTIHIGCASYYRLETVKSWLRDQETRGLPDVPKDADSSAGGSK